MEAWKRALARHRRNTSTCRFVRRIRISSAIGADILYPDKLPKPESCRPKGSYEVYQIISIITSGNPSAYPKELHFDPSATRANYGPQLGWALRGDAFFRLAETDKRGNAGVLIGRAKSSAVS